MEERKQKEREMHNALRDKALESDAESFKRLNSNKKFYSITRSSLDFVKKWLVDNSRGKKVLDYCCGNGGMSIFLAQNGAAPVGIDISDTSIENCKKLALQMGVKDKATFVAMDAENTTFENNTFDVAVCSGVLHHLDTAKAFAELARVVKPGGKVICAEPLAYNPVFQMYRKFTPHLRTKWEMGHILGKRDLERAADNFSGVEVRFFHLFTIAAVPFRNTRAFSLLLRVLEAVDGAVLKLPGIKWMAWQMVFILTGPKK